VIAIEYFYISSSLLKSDKVIIVPYFLQYLGGSFEEVENELATDSDLNVLIEILLLLTLSDLLDLKSHLF
jgi:hypothetical protein